MMDQALIVLVITDRSGADYFEWIDMGSYVGLDNPLWMEYTFLKDNLTTGGTWQSAPFTGPLYRSDWHYHLILH